MLTQTTTESERFTESLIQEVEIPERESEPPWGWVVCFGAFVIQFITLGQHNSSGVLFAGFLAEYKSSRMETGIATQITFTATYENVCCIYSLSFSKMEYLIIHSFFLCRLLSEAGDFRKLFRTFQGDLPCVTIEFCY